MSTTLAPVECGRRYELRFAGLFYPGLGYAFPCYPDGNPSGDFISDFVSMMSPRIRLADVGHAIQGSA